MGALVTGTTFVDLNWERLWEAPMTRTRWGEPITGSCFVDLDGERL